jgi:hypothetical protein
MTTIEIDFDVFKELTIRRQTESVTYNEILREVLGLGQPKVSTPTHINASAGAWTTKGVTFPEGTEFRATHKGKAISARVESGGLFLNGIRYDSPSAAAVSITGNMVNGWIFWECRLPNKSSWQLIKTLRK